jgi:predicted DNA-binding transcriptional regulator AlpA
MIVDVELRVTGVDLDDEKTGEILGKNFPNTLWEENSGLITVTVFAEQDNLVASVIEQSRQLEAALPGLRILGVYRDLVSVTAIAHRIGLSREGVRKWTTETDFPAPASVLDPGSMKVWPWSEVIDWGERRAGCRPRGSRPLYTRGDPDRQLLDAEPRCEHRHVGSHPGRSPRPISPQL